MDIVIKSFNRAYLLDRVLHSIYNYVDISKHRIIILDDGTPKKYLDKLQEKYLNIDLIFSPFYDKKSSGEREKMNAPTQFWRSEISKLSDYFLLIEDDIWMNQETDLLSIENICKKNDISFFKLRWWANDKMISGKYTEVEKNLGLMDVKLPLRYELLVKNKYFLHSICILLRIMPQNYFVPLYSIYDVGGQIFSKEFYLNIWPEKQDRIEEMIQLGNAATWFRKDRSKQIGRSLHEMLNTTFRSSATGNKEKLGFSMDQCNTIWNNAWLEGKFDPLKNFPEDFPIDYLSSFLTPYLSKNEIDSWITWSNNWESHFKEMGSKINLT
ncbi:glycosyltransferase family 2 protein [Sphingobacterium sp. UBA7038]|uniref:glycosyltransferase family 2 protein n=1 Tax=Sphingobacterium TaxID=28453 RepID=UPI00257A6FA1|nr:glycosyltransferase [Sphingobacterium sp. UBA7038]